MTQYSLYMGGSIALGSFWSDLVSGTIKSCFRIWKKIDFWALQKNNHASGCQVWHHDYFFETPKKTIFLYPNATSNGTPVMGISKAVQNNWTHPPKVNIEQATAICLKKNNISGVPLEVALGWQKFYFWVFQKIIM